MADPKQADNADWYVSMFDQQSELTKRAVNEANRLRRRVRELEGKLAGGTAATLSELQDRVTMLEQQLAAARGVMGNGDHSSCSETPPKDGKC